MFKFFKKPAGIITILITVVLGIVVVRALTKPAESPYHLATAEKKNIVREVTVTGQVQPVESVDLAFEQGGKVQRVAVKIGDVVNPGAVLVALNSAEEQAQLIQYRAALEREEVRLAELRRGARPEDIRLAEIKVENAKKTVLEVETNLTLVTQKADLDLANLYGGIRDVLFDAYTKADDAAAKQTEELFSNDSSEAPALTFVTAETQAESRAEAGRAAATRIVLALRARIDALPVDTAGREQALRDTEADLILIRNFLNDLTDALNGAINVSAATLATYKASVNTGRANINTALSAIETRTQALATQRVTNQNNSTAASTRITDAQSALIAAEAELTLKRVGPTADQIDTQEANIKQAQGTVLSAMAQISKSTLIAPMQGVVTKQEAQVGEIVTGGSPIVSLISEAQFEIEAQIPEADIARVAVGNEATVTLDAYGSDQEFTAHVSEIDPAETVVEGVSTYRVVIQFDMQDERIKSGMTANVTITVDKRDAVLAVPQRAVIKRDGKEFAKVLRNEVAEEVEVTTGLRGSDGSVEIISGIAEGDSVVTNP